jgi:hypothetical protein
MRDGEPDRESTVFEAAAEAGLAPGADEQIEAALREMFPHSRSQPVRYVTHLPAESSLNGWVRDTTVYFLKSYEGQHYGGYRVGDYLVGHKVEGHSVHYKGAVAPDGQEIEGKWWIDAPPEFGGRRAEGSFFLRRANPRSCQEARGEAAEAFVL